MEVGTRPCGLDWLFGVLYVASQEKSGVAPRCSVVIPLTLLFNAGTPTKVLVTDTPTKSVRGFATPFQQAPVTGSKEAGSYARKCFRYCAEMLHEYSEQNGYGQGGEGPLVCTVTYADGEREHFTMERFAALYRTDPWRMQIKMVQGYVPCEGVQTGVYLRRSRVQSLIGDGGSEAAHQLTRSLATFADQVYALSAEKAFAAEVAQVRRLAEEHDEMNRGRRQADEVRASHTRLLAAEQRLRERPPKGTVHVSEMEAIYGLDKYDRIIFLYTQKALLDTVSSSSSSSSSGSSSSGGGSSSSRSMSEATKKNLMATMETEIAVAVGRDLLRLLTQARKKGLDDSMSFAHFDVRRAGIVDANDLVDGLSRLGIGVSLPVAELVLQNIAGLGSEVVTAQDFVKFLDRADEMDADNPVRQLKLNGDADATVAMADGSRPRGAGGRGKKVRPKRPSSDGEAGHDVVFGDENAHPNVAYDPLRPPPRPGLRTRAASQRTRKLPPLGDATVHQHSDSGSEDRAPAAKRRRGRPPTEGPLAVALTVTAGHGHMGDDAIDESTQLLPFDGSEESDATAEDEISLLNSQLQFGVDNSPPPPDEEAVFNALKAKYHWPSLPVDEALYRVVRPKPGESASGGFGIFDLPPWARDSQRRSLAEIRDAHRRWKRRKREEADKVRLLAEQEVRDRAEAAAKGGNGEGDDAGSAAFLEDQDKKSFSAVEAQLMTAANVKRRMQAAVAVADRWQAQNQALRHKRQRRLSFSGKQQPFSPGAVSGDGDSSVDPDTWNRLLHGTRPQPPFPLERTPPRTHRDEFLDLGHGLAMTFRVVEGEGSHDVVKTKEKTDALRYRSILELREKNLARFHVAGTSTSDTESKLKDAAEAAEKIKHDVVDYGGGRTSPPKLAKGSPTQKRAGKRSGGGGGGDGLLQLKSPLRSSSAHPSRSPAPSLLGKDGHREVFSPSSTPSKRRGKSAHPVLQQSTADEAQAAINRWIAFTLVVVPDLFMTADAAEAYLLPLLTKFPMARLVVLGLPGAPHTTWPAHWVLNPDLHARALAKAMTQLHATGRLASFPHPPENVPRSPEDTEPIFFMGFGTGGHALARFASSFMSELPWLMGRVRAVVLVNALMEISRAFKKLCTDLRRGLLMGTHPEVHAMIGPLHFYEELLHRRGPETLLDEFWSHREALSVGGMPSEEAGLAFVGVLAQLKGLITASQEGFDGAAALLKKSEVPVVVVQSTEDQFVSPKNAAAFQGDRLPPNRILVSSIADSLDIGAVHVSWLRAGHEVLQERTNFILGLVGNLAQICGIHPSWQAVAAAGGRQKVNADDDFMDVLRASEERAAKREEERRAAEAARIQKEREKREAKRQRKDAKAAMKDKERRELEEAAAKRLAEESAAAEEMAREREQQMAEEAARVAAEVARRRRALRDEEKEAQIKRAEERKRRADERAYEQMLQAIYQQSVEFGDQETAREEILLMEREDIRSHYANQFFHYEEACARSQAIARDKLNEVFYFRRAAAIKRVEDRLAREHMEHRLAMRRKADAALKKMIEDDLYGFDKDLTEYASVDDPDINKVITSARGLLQNFMDCRSKFVDVLRRQLTAQEQMDSFQEVVNTMQKALQKKRRELQKLKKKQSGTAMARARAGATSSKAAIDRALKIDEMQSYVDKEAARVQEIVSLMRGRQKTVDAVNYSCQTLKNLEHEKDGRIKTYMAQMKDLEKHFLKKLKTIKIEKEYTMSFKDTVLYKLKVGHERLQKLRKERNRVRNHAAHFVDTALHDAGMVQRVVTAHFKKYLREQIDKEKNMRDDLLRELDGHREAILECSLRMEKVKRDGDKITIALKILKKTYEGATRLTMTQVLRQSMQQQAEADAADAARKRREAEDSRLDALGAVSLADKARKKDYEQRTKEERQFLALDLVMHPELFENVPLMEAEQMRFDEDYQTDLSAEDLARIDNLPHNVALALPYLPTRVEVEAHRLLNKYTRGLDDDTFRDADARTPVLPHDSVTPLSPEEAEALQLVRRAEEATGKTFIYASEARAALRAHDALVRAASRDRIRQKCFDDDDLDDEERDWIQLDRMLSPWVFSADELLRKGSLSTVDERDVYVDLSTMLMSTGKLKGIVLPTKRVLEERAKRGLVTRLKTMAQKMAEHVDGDVWDELRERYDNGEEVFDYSWLCPFTRDQLLEIAAAADLDDLRFLQEGATQENVDNMAHVWRLMKKYYVSEEDTVLGRQHLEHLLSYDRAAQRLTAAVDAAASLKLDEVKRQFDEESDALDREYGSDDGNDSSSATATGSQPLDGDSSLFSALDVAQKEPARRKRTVRFEEDDPDPSLAAPSGLAASERSVSSAASATSALTLPVSPMSSKGNASADAALSAKGASLTVGNSSGGVGGSERPPQSRKSSTRRKLSDLIHRRTAEVVPSAEEIAAAAAAAAAAEAAAAAKKEVKSKYIRVWGPWDKVHPACGGVQSQMDLFTATSFDPQQHHPAMYAVDDTVISEEMLSQRGVDVSLSTKALHDVHVDPEHEKMVQADPFTTQFKIVENVPELATQDPRSTKDKRVCLISPEPFDLLTDMNKSLEARESRTHVFVIPDTDDLRVLDMTVVVEFHGGYHESQRKFRAGRIGVGLYRLPAEGTPQEAPVPQQLGYSPYSQQSPNLPDALGRVVIFHRPIVKPLRPGSFKVVVSAARMTKYSLQVSCQYAHLALPVVEDRLERAKAMQKRLPHAIREIESLDESLRLAERKMLVCRKMVLECELELRRIQYLMTVIADQMDHNADLVELGAKRNLDVENDLQRELSILEIESAQWIRLYGSREEERVDIKDGMFLMYELRRQRIKERERIREELEVARRDLPSCIVLLKSVQEGVKEAAALNTVVHQGSFDALILASKDDLSGTLSLASPAEDVRMRHRKDGFKALSLHEQQWVMLDRVLRPHKYEWLVQEEAEEDEERARAGKRPKDCKIDPMVEQFKWSRYRIEWALDRPFDLLSRPEIHVRKLLSRYNDPLNKVITQKMKDEERKTKDVDEGKIVSDADKAAAAEASKRPFDPHLAAKVRAKNRKLFTKEEREWRSIDTVLHPEVWAFYSNHDEDAIFDTASKKKNFALSFRVDRDSDDGGDSSNDDVDDVSAAAGGDQDRRKLMRKRRSKRAMSFRDRMKELGVKDEARQPRVMKSSRSLAVSRARLQAKEGDWVCDWGKNHILRVWRSKTRRELATEEEKHARDLLLKYNGPYEEYAKAMLEADFSRTHGVGAEDLVTDQAVRFVDTYGNVHEEAPPEATAMAGGGGTGAALPGSESGVDKWRDGVDAHKRRGEKMREKAERIRLDKMTANRDPDHRARGLLREVDRAITNRRETMDSDELHEYPQRFPAHMLRIELETALDALLRDEILERERSRRLDDARLNENDSDCDEDDLKEGLKPKDYDVTTVTTDLVKKVRREEQAVQLAAERAADFGGEEARQRVLRQASERRLPQGVSLELVKSLGLDPLEVVMMGKVMTAVNRESRRRQKRMVRRRLPSGEQELIRAKRALAAKNLKGDELSEAILAHQLGPGGCVPCRSNPCCWRPSVHVDAYELRIHVLRKEMERVKRDRSYAIETEVVQSAMGKGSILMLRSEVIEEIILETRRIQMKLDLNAVDKEFHDLIMDKRDYVQVEHLHGFTAVMWRKHAITALKHRQHTLVAEVVAIEIVDDIIDYMMEGWYFGEWQPEVDKSAEKGDGAESDGDDNSEHSSDDEETRQRHAEEKRLRELDREAEQDFIVVDGVKMRRRVDPIVQMYKKHVLAELANKNKDDEYLLSAEEQERAMIEQEEDRAAREARKVDALKGATQVIATRTGKGKSLAVMQLEAKAKMKEKIEDLREEKYGFKETIRDATNATKDDGAVAAPSTITLGEQPPAKRPGHMPPLPPAESAVAAAAAAAPQKKKNVPFWKEEKSKKVARNGNEHEQVLNETETNIRFGLFMLTLMYFRAIYYLRTEVREKEAKAKREADRAAGLPVAMEEKHRAASLEEMRNLEQIRRDRLRKRKLDAVTMQQKVGYTRRLLREADEVAEARLTLLEMVREQARESRYVRLIQRFYRGHVARKASRRWALKLAEMKALHLLMSAAALTLQRFYRGHLGRDQARRKRAGFGYFVNLMRVEESKDQQEYFENMQQIAHAAHIRYEKVMNRLGYREPRKTVEEMRAEVATSGPFNPDGEGDDSSEARRREAADRRLAELQAAAEAEAAPLPDDEAALAEATAAAAAKAARPLSAKNEEAEADKFNDADLFGDEDGPTRAATEPASPTTAAAAAESPVLADGADVTAGGVDGAAPEPAPSPAKGPRGLLGLISPLRLRPAAKTDATSAPAMDSPTKAPDATADARDGDGERRSGFLRRLPLPSLRSPFRSPPRVAKTAPSPAPASEPAAAPSPAPTPAPADAPEPPSEADKENAAAAAVPAADNAAAPAVTQPAAAAGVDAGPKEGKASEKPTGLLGKLPVPFSRKAQEGKAPAAAPPAKK